MALTRVVVALIATATYSRALTDSECKSRGFVVGELACRTCALVRRTLGEDTAAFADCVACCSTTLDWRSPRRFDTAVLQLGRAGAAQFHGVNEFLEKGGEAEFAPELTVWDVRGAPPTLTFLDADAADEAELRTQTPEAAADGAGNNLIAARGNSLSVSVADWKVEYIRDAIVRKLKRYAGGNSEASGASATTSKAKANDGDAAPSAKGKAKSKKAATKAARKQSASNQVD